MAAAPSDTALPPTAGAPKVVLTRRKFDELRSTFEQRLDPVTCDWVMQSMCTQLGFDPSKKIYTPDLGRQQRDGRRRKAAEHGMGVSEFLRARKAGALPTTPQLT